MSRPVVLVTGAAGGIGRATAVEFARRGYDVALLDLDGVALTPVADEVRAAGGTALAQGCDLADLEFAEMAVAFTAERFGRLDVLVNNAAWRELTTMRRITPESWDRTLRVCLTAPAFLARWAAAVMEPRGRGVIVNVTSIMAERTSGIAPAYVAAKGGLATLTSDLACLYGPAGVRVVAVAPGAIDTDLSRDSGAADEARRASEDEIPLARWAAPEEIARVIAWVASDEASYLHGTTVTVDGGWSNNLNPRRLKRAQFPEDFR